MTDFVDPATLGVSYLNNSTPTGLHRSVEKGEEALFLVLEKGDRRFAVVLEHVNSEVVWLAFELDDDETNWAGLDLGPVEFEVDPADVVIAGMAQSSIGLLTIRADGVFLTAKGRSLTDRYTFQLSRREAQPGARLSFNFPSWRLIQRLEHGKVRELFSTGASEE